MKAKVIAACMNIIKNNETLTQEKLEEIEYGLITVYILVTKLIVIFTLALILNIFKEVLIFSIIYATIRTPSFGLHASKSWICLIVSSILFLGIPYLCLNITIPLLYKIFLGIVFTILICKNSPADTHKRPIINKKRRRNYKIISTVIAICYTSLMIIDNNFISNCLLFALITQSIIISPITYKVFKMPHNNYKNYCPV